MVLMLSFCRLSDLKERESEPGHLTRHKTERSDIEFHATFEEGGIEIQTRIAGRWHSAIASEFTNVSMAALTIAFAQDICKLCTIVPDH